MKITKQTALLVMLLAALSFSKSFSQISISPWQIHEGTEGVVKHTNAIHGDRSAYKLAKIPGKNDGGWNTAPKDASGNVSMKRSSVIKCREELDFTYFQTIVNIPANVNVSDFKVSYDNADDGARIYFFNSKFPNGTFDEKSDLVGKHANFASANMKDKIVKGENRVVVAQFDDCADNNSINGIRISVNGKEVAAVQQANDGVCTVYEHVNFGGKSKSFGVGFHELSGTDFNDIISSIKLQPGYSIRVFEHWKSTGNSTTYTSSASSLMNGGFNDKISSIEIIKGSAPAASLELPAKFKVHAFSVGEGKSDKDDYWFALNNNNSRGVILSQKKLGANAKWMEIQKVDLGSNMVAFKVMNAGTDMYLVAKDNKEVHVINFPGGNLSDGAKFKTTTALTTTNDASAKNYRSFESVKFANHFLRHTGFILFVHTSNNTELFKQDASWLIQKM